MTLRPCSVAGDIISGLGFVRYREPLRRCTMCVSVSVRIGVSTRASQNSSSGACLRRHSRCHEFPPSRSVLRTSLRSRHSKIHRLQIDLHGSEPGLPWTTNPPSPVVRWTCYAGLESPVMIMPRVGAAEMSNEGQTTAADSV